MPNLKYPINIRDEFSFREKYIEMEYESNKAPNYIGYDTYSTLLIPSI